MSIKNLLEISLILQVSLGVIVIGTMAMRRKFEIFGHLASLISVQIVCGLLSVTFLYHRRLLHFSAHQAYETYFWQAWIVTLLELVLRVLVIRAVFAEAMRPMAGLHAVGKIIFKWVAVVSCLVALALVAGPNVTSNVDAFLQALGKLEQGVSVLTLCLLVFVCFAVRPLGLTFRSHLFGVSLGLGIASTVELVQAAWAMAGSGRNLFSAPYVFGSFGFSTALLIWGLYFALPEPKRRMILLPTTSPFFFWNRISEILGDAPGHVAVAGFSPNMLADAEIEMLTAATANEAETANGSQAAGMQIHTPEFAVQMPLPTGASLGSGIRPSLAM